ncbi:biopolymer transporter ExbD [Myxococcota bacterium]|nr:biopolymer transporter ExbD [Myxococcota bacterium]
MKFRATRRVMPTLDITPLIDIIFQLVLFFMVSTTFISAPGIQVDLPRSSAEVVLSDKEQITLWLTEKGEVYVDDQPVTRKDLDARLRAVALKDPSSLVIIKADAAVDHGRVVTVMDLARRHGLSRIAIATDPQGQGSKSPDETPGN